MALLTPSASGAAQSNRAATQKKSGGIVAAQALAKQKALEKKSKTYKLPMGELAMFTRRLDLNGLLREVEAVADAPKVDEGPRDL